jgi:hypothetical protein
LVLFAAAACGEVSVARAVAPAPGWSISSDAEPTSFSAAETRDAVQAFAVSATGGSYELSVNGGENAGELSAPIEWNESAAGVQAKLEGVPDIGAGNVQVSGGPGDELGDKPYFVAYVGALSGSGRFLLLRKSLLTGGGHTLRQETASNTEGEAHDRYTVTVANVGSQPSTGPITIVDQLPAQLAAVAATLEERPTQETKACTTAIPVVCEYTQPVAPGARLVLTIQAALRSPSFSSPVINTAIVAGGGATAGATASESTPVGVGASPFGIEQFAFEANGLDGLADTQAGDHPYSVTATTSLNTTYVGEAGLSPYTASQEAKNVAVELPLGFVADPLVAERCPEVDMTIQTGVAESGRTACPPTSIVGEVWLDAEGRQWAFGPYPVYDVVPERGYPAELAFNAAGLGQPVFLYASILPSAAGYRVRIATPGALRTLNFDLERVALTIFGDPSAHNGGAGHAAFATNPTSCSTEPLEARLEVNSWKGSSDAREAVAYPQMSGCNLLQGVAAFSPTIAVEPEQSQADTPSGYEIDLRVPQAPDVFGQPATPELRDASIALPAGLSLSPSAASGENSLEGCTAQEIDLLGVELGAGHGGPYDDGLMHAAPGHCPAKSQLGDVELKTPLLEQPLLGHVYLAAPSCGGAAQPPCTSQSASNGELFGLYLELAGSGVIVKLHGKVAANLVNGQLTATFTENPQLPFEALRITLYGGPRAVLANSQSCGVSSAGSELVPWSAPSTPPATPSATFQVTGCADPMPFAPAFSAGTTQAIAGGFAALRLTLTRKDGEQDFGGVSVTLPRGVSGITSMVAQCGEAQANAGACPESSRIGTAHLAAGAGSEPLWLEGPVYFTGPYRGAPFGLSIVVPAKAGPFNLGEEVVRAGIDVDPRTAQVTVAADPLRSIRDGIPFRLKTIDVDVDRPQFIVNPTDCAQQQLAGTISGGLPDGSPGAIARVSTPFAVSGCRDLPFHPSFTVSTRGATSKAGGASLDVKVSMPAGSANMGEVHVSLPKQLPSRLDTLKLACVDRVFEANPAACPPASGVGMASATTPIVAHTLSGPAYLVSHGGTEFPDLEIVLQGEGVTLILDGKTDVERNITSSTFATLPDAPVRSFELILPQGSHSVLGAPGGKLCSASLTMPTLMRAHSGALLRQSTRIAVTGCKPEIEVVRHGVKGTTATIVARVPAAGVLVASAPGLSRAVKRTGRQARLTVALTLNAAERRFLALHPGRRLQARVRLRFTYEHKRRERLETGVTLLIG